MSAARFPTRRGKRRPTPQADRWLDLLEALPAGAVVRVEYPTISRARGGRNIAHFAVDELGDEGLRIRRSGIAVYAQRVRAAA